MALLQIYLKLGEPERAVMQLSMAQDLEPSAAESNEIKVLKFTTYSRPLGCFRFEVPLFVSNVQALLEKIEVPE